MYASTSTDQFTNGSTATLKAAVYMPDAQSQNGKAISVVLKRVGDSNPYETKTITANGAKMDVEFTVSDAGQYYVEANGVSSSDQTSPYDSARVSYKSGQSANAADQASWSNDYGFEYNVEKVNGSYTVTGDDVFAVSKVTDPFGGEVDTADYSVVYLDANGVLVKADQAVNGRVGGFPKAPNALTTYKIAVVKGDLTGENLDAIYDVNGLMANWSTKVQDFKIKPVTASLEGASAFEYNATATDSGMSDVEFSYTGTEQVGIAVNGKKLAQSDYTVALKSAPKGAELQTTAVDANGCIDLKSAPAGDYVVTVFGNGTTFVGQVDVKFTIGKVDLSAASISASDLKAGTNSNLATDGSDILVNGTAVSGLKVEPFGFVDPDGKTNASFGDMDKIGSYTYKVVADDTDAVALASLDGTGYVTVNVYTNLVTGFKYGSQQIIYKDGESTPGASDANVSTAAKPFATFVTSLGQAFNGNNITLNGSRDGFTYKVYDLEGNEATDLSKAGTYKLVVTADTDGSFSKGGSETGYFKVVDTTFDPTAASVKGYAAIDGEMLSTVSSSYTKLPYKAAAYDYQVAVKDDGKALSSDLYTVSLTDDKGNAVESIEGVGKYVITVKFNGYGDTGAKKFYVEVEKANIVSAAPTADFFAIGETPSFYGYTKAGQKGQRFELASGDIDVVYRDADGSKVKFEDIDEAGTYTAEINVLSTCETLKTTDSVKVSFEVKETAGYSDVDANAWYAGAVYDAKDLKYMTGIAGTKLFMPESQITRAEVAQVFFNMAGQSDEDGKFPTQFSDVDPEAWYAQAIAWASQAGVVGGYDGTDVFGTFDNATREQVATMIYRYAKAQGMDVTVEDEAKALSAYKDADQLTFGKTAMAWCVEKGIFGVGVDTLRPTDNLSRAEMAATAVRVQPEALV